jgi:protein O-GlcNAc transferase
MNIDKALNLVVEYYQKGDIKQAEVICKKILKKKPNNVDALHFLGITYSQRGDHNLAIKYIKKALQIDPNLADAYNNLGNIFQEIKKLDEAISCYKKAIQLNPNLAKTYYNLGIALQDKGNIEEAITSYKKAVQLNLNIFGLYNNLGLALQNKRQLDEAIQYYQKALQINPSFVEAYNNIGNSLKEKGQLDEAIDNYQRALHFDPNCADAYYNLGIALQEKGQLNEAITCYQKALQLKPDFAVAYSNLFHQFQRTCTWQGLEVMTAKLDGLTKKALDTGTKPAESPFISITRHADLSINLAIAKLWSRDIARVMSNLKIHFSFDGRRAGKTKIVIGYLSNDFRNHATAHLMLSLFGLHHRDEFEIFCYSYGKDDGSYYRTKIQHDCDKFVDISNLSYDAAAKLIYEDQVDILVDLKGYTGDNRLEICALRPAPIQVTYLGFPGTTGADFIDYVITDKIVTPLEHVPYYSEKFVYLPHCYQVNDYTQPISNKEWEKENFGLPESCFVFCCFNHPYKIDPVMFDVWMRILQQVPEGVLWLFLGNNIAEENLIREAEARGIKSERLIFIGMLPKDEHLGRFKFADLSLDTRIVNGHTTTSDALWAGVPVITLQGSHFASRVSSSILFAIGLPELIAYSLEEYEALAVRLAQNPFELQEIRQRIAQNRLVAPLFDTPRFVRNLETAYKEMWKIFFAGKAPRQIEVQES